MQEQDEFGRLLDLFDGARSRVERTTGHDRAMVGQQERTALACPQPHCLCQLEAARPGVGHQDQPADPHHGVRRQGREHVVRIHVLEAGHGDRIGRVQVHDRLGVGLLVVHGQVKRQLLGGGRSVDKLSLPVQARQARPVQRPERQTRGRHQPPLPQPGTDVAGRPGGEAPSGQGAPQRHDLVPQLDFFHLVAHLVTSSA